MRIAGLEYWKWLCMVLLAYTVYRGMTIEVPELPILHQSIRNLFFHVTIWFAMIILMAASIYYGVLFLRTGDLHYDLKASSCINTGVFAGILGLLTGSLWARNTWGAWWVNDAKLNGAAAAMLVYFAYLVLRGSLDEPQKRARVAAVYSIFAFTMMLTFIMILPRMTDSLHPGNGGNPGFSGYDLDSKMRTVFYPAVIGWTLLGAWITQIEYRIRKHQLMSTVPSPSSESSYSFGKKTISVVALLALCGQAVAQENADASACASCNKMDVVVGVLLILLIGIFVYLVWLDRKVERMNKRP